MKRIRRRPQINLDEKMLIKLHTYVPRSIYRILVEKSTEKNLSIAKLISYAIDNELDTPVPFNYPCPMPENTFIELAYINEGQAIRDYVGKFLNGADLDTLMLSRRDMGIKSRTDFMLGFRDFWESGLAEKTIPNKNTGTEYISLKNNQKKAYSNRRKLLEEKARIERELAAFDVEEQS